MKRAYCDRCDKETTGKKSGSIMGVDDADSEGNGNVTDRFDVCPSCYRDWCSFMNSKPAPPKRRSQP